MEVWLELWAVDTPCWESCGIQYMMLHFELRYLTQWGGRGGRGGGGGGSQTNLVDFVVKALVHVHRTLNQHVSTCHMVYFCRCWRTHCGPTPWSSCILHIVMRWSPQSDLISSECTRKTYFDQKASSFVISRSSFEELMVLWGLWTRLDPIAPSMVSLHVLTLPLNVKCILMPSFVQLPIHSSIF